MWGVWCCFMAGWYGHTITVNIDDTFKFPSLTGRTSIINRDIQNEIARLNRKLKFTGSQISYDIAKISQIHQRNTITKLGAVDTGTLRDSVQITGNGLVSTIGTSLYYASTVHDVGYQNQKIFNINGLIIRGHSDIGPRPWVDVSAEMVADEIDGIVKEHLSKII